ncbi:MAG: replication protein [Patescibacteria group bacterium]|jgi:phage replication O-like protein O
MFNTNKNTKSGEGFTMISHKLYSWLMEADLGKPKLKIILAITRQTIGYHYEEAPMSFRFIGKMTNIHHRNIEKYIKELLDKEIIFQRTGDKMKWGKKIFIYRLNKNIWRSPYASQENCRMTDASTGVNFTPKTGVNTTPIKDTKKYIERIFKILLINSLTIKKAI